MTTRCWLRIIPFELEYTLGKKREANHRLYPHDIFSYILIIFPMLFSLQLVESPKNHSTAGKIYGKPSFFIVFHMKSRGLLWFAVIFVPFNPSDDISLAKHHVQCGFPGAPGAIAPSVAMEGTVVPKAAAVRTTVAIHLRTEADVTTTTRLSISQPNNSSNNSNNNKW